MQSMTRAQSGSALSPIATDVEHGLQMTPPSVSPMSSQASPTERNLLFPNPALAGLPQRPSAATRSVAASRDRLGEASCRSLCQGVAVFGATVTAAGGAMLGVGVKRHLEQPQDRGPEGTDATSNELLMFMGGITAFGGLTIAAISTRIACMASRSDV